MSKIEFRIPDDKKAEIQKAATHFNFKNVTAFIKGAIKSFCNKANRVYDTLKSNIDAKTRIQDKRAIEINRIGNNINQLVKEIHISRHKGESVDWVMGFSLLAEMNLALYDILDDEEKDDDDSED